MKYLMCYLKPIYFYFSKALYLVLLSIILTASFGAKAQEHPQNPPIKKQNLFFDKRGLTDGFEPSDMSGTESGGGGAIDRDLFYSVMRKVIIVLIRETSINFNDGTKIETNKLGNALRSITLMPTYTQLYDKEKVPVDLYNDPEQLIIRFNVPKWLQMTETEKIHFGLHELLGILKIPDPYYKYSKQLQQYYVEASKINPPKIELQSQSFDRSAIFEFLQSAKSNNENIVLSNQCEQFVPQFEGFCLIKSVIENGETRQLIYLVQEASENFHNNDKVEKVEVYSLRTIIDVPNDKLSFVIAVLRVDFKTIEVFNKKDCLAKKLISKASQVSDGNLCLVVR